VRLLLDTHAFLWSITNDQQLGATAKALIADPNNGLLRDPAKQSRAKNLDSRPIDWSE
jgi:PIN domain nuclease of toxin-antitoxin system